MILICACICSSGCEEFNLKKKNDGIEFDELRFDVFVKNYLISY